MKRRPFVIYHTGAPIKPAPLTPVVRAALRSALGRAGRTEAAEAFFERLAWALGTARAGALGDGRARREQAQRLHESAEALLDALRAMDERTLMRLKAAYGEVWIESRPNGPAPLLDDALAALDPSLRGISEASRRAARSLTRGRGERHEAQDRAAMRAAIAQAFETSFPRLSTTTKHGPFAAVLATLRDYGLTDRTRPRNRRIRCISRVRKATR